MASADLDRDRVVETGEQLQTPPQSDVDTS